MGVKETETKKITQILENQGYYFLPNSSMNMGGKAINFFFNPEKGVAINLIVDIPNKILRKAFELECGI